MPRTPIHPDEHLAEQLAALGMSAAPPARHLGMPRHRVSSIVKIYELRSAEA
jgi:antitoxin HigA-1